MSQFAAVPPPSPPSARRQAVPTPTSAGRSTPMARKNGVQPLHPSHDLLPVDCYGRITDPSLHQFLTWPASLPAIASRGTVSLNCQGQMHRMSFKMRQPAATGETKPVVGTRTIQRHGKKRRRTTTPRLIAAADSTLRPIRAFGRISGVRATTAIGF